ncbi:MAG TPA: hemolysin family protein [bacterium]|nr:hemolysin family protein [bacterium]
MIGLAYLALALTAAVLFGAFFSGAQAAIVSADPAALKKKGRDSARDSVRLERFLKRPQWYLGAALIGSSLCLTLAAVPATLFALGRSGPAGAAALLGAATLYVFIGVVLPKTFFGSLADSSALGMAAGLRYFIFIFYPLLMALLGIIWVAQKLLAGGRPAGAFWYTRDELQLLLTNHTGGEVLDEERRQMIDRIFEFSETLVEDVMIPLVQVEALANSATVGEALRKVSERMYSRYPVYQDRIDNIIGVLHAVDLLESDDLAAPIGPWVSEARYVPFNKPVDELLFSMQRENYNFAMVVDEYGGCIGVISRENILEEIVGEIGDEHTRPVKMYQRLAPDRVSVNAQMEIDEINEELGWELPEGNYDTLAGFLLHLFRRIPETGERIRFKDLAFTVKQAAARAVTQVEVEEGAARRKEGPSSV